jgi:hypothetical protein
MAIDKVSTSFHEGFPLNLPSVAGILKIAIEKKGEVSFEDLKVSLSLGNNYIKAMPRYARASGLLAFDSFKPTLFGKFVYEKDPNLTSLSTLWLMHYHLSVLHGPGPVFWNYIITRLLRFGGEYKSIDLGVEISTYLSSIWGDDFKERTTKDSARVLLRSYSRNDGLGDLGILTEKKDIYIANEVDPPSRWVVGYALADYWENVYQERTSVNFADITASEGFISLFFMGTGFLLSTLAEIQREGFLQVQRVAPPHQLVKLWPNKEIFLEKIYA